MLANHPEALHITVHCMGPASAGRADAWLNAVTGKTLVVPDKKGDVLNGSRGHGACIMNALAMTGDGEIHIVVDSDTVMVAKGWDDYIRNRLINDGIGMIGTTYEDLGGFSSGASNIQTYKKVPTFTWAALSPNHSWKKLNVMPNKAHRVHISTPLLASIYNLPIGYNVFGEAAWQIPQYLHDNGLNYEGWRQLKPTKDAVVLKGLSDYHEEYHVDNNVPFVVHHRGSMRHVYRGDKISKQFYAAVDVKLALEATQPSRWSWNDSGKVISISNPQPSAVSESTVDNPNISPEAFVPVGKEWLKVCLNGSVIRPRAGVTREKTGIQLDFNVPAVDKIGHLRVEGTIEHDYPVNIPVTKLEPYMLTFRNATQATLLVTCAGKNDTIHVPGMKTFWLLVDVDGVQRLE